MDLAQQNKFIRKELERLTKESRVLSSIYVTLQSHLSEEQAKQVRSEVEAFVKSSFTEKEIEEYYRRNENRLRFSALESEILDITRPKRNDD